MKILITEEQKNMLVELAWKDPLTSHIKAGRFPLTKKIRQALYGEKYVTTFHVSDIDNIDKVKQLIGANKTLSSFTYMSEYMLPSLRGIQTMGGILYELKGKLVLHSHHDIMSRPDENGYRWISQDDFLPDRSEHGNYINSLHEIWTSYVRSDSFRNNTKMLNDKSYGINRTNFIRFYITKAQDYILNNIDEIKKKLEKDSGWGDWNEILVSNIEIHDILWTESSIQDRIERIERKRHDETDNYGNPLIKGQIIRDIELLKNKINDKLNSMSTGTVYSIPTPNNNVINKFVTDRGGFIKRDDYREKNIK